MVSLPDLRIRRPLEHRHGWQQIGPQSSGSVVGHAGCLPGHPAVSQVKAASTDGRMQEHFPGCVIDIAAVLSAQLPKARICTSWALQSLSLWPVLPQAHGLSEAH